MELNVVFIGAGNVAWHLAPALDNLGYAVRGVFSQERKNAKALVGRLYEAEVLDSLDLTNRGVQWVIVAVPDDAIETVSKEMAVDPHTVVTHTSGAVSIEALSYLASPHTGVFYPLQTFSKGRPVKISEVPFLLEASDEETEKILFKAGKALSKTVKIIDTQKRKAIHVAAVFACNFTNHMLSLANDELRKVEIDFDLVKPLVVETLNKSMEIGPDEAQTGPAIRNDFDTMDQHYDYLDDEQIQQIYRLISQSIMDRYS